MRKDKTGLLLAGTLVLLGGLTLLLWRTGFFEAARSLAGIEAYIGRFSPHSQLVFFLLQLTTVILAPIPSNLMAAAGGVIFGTIPAFLLTFSAVILGSLLVFFLARNMGQGRMERLLDERVSARYLTPLRDRREFFLGLAFLFPFFPDDILCILAGLTDLSARRFLLLLLLTRPWGLLVACWVGDGVPRFSLPVLMVLGLLGLILFLAGMKYGVRLERFFLRQLEKKKK